MIIRYNTYYSTILNIILDNVIDSNFRCLESVIFYVAPHNIEVQYVQNEAV